MLGICPFFTSWFQNKVLSRLFAPTPTPLLLIRPESPFDAIVNRVWEYMGGITGSSQQISHLLEKIRKKPNQVDVIKLQKVVKCALGENATDKQAAIQAEHLLQGKTSSAARKWLERFFQITFLDKQLMPMLFKGAALGATIGACWHLKAMIPSLWQPLNLFKSQTTASSHLMHVAIAVVALGCMFLKHTQGSAAPLALTQAKQPRGVITTAPTQPQQPVAPLALQPLPQPLSALQVKPRGFKNNSGTDCCFIAAMQLMLAIPYFKNILQTQVSPELVEADQNKAPFDISPLRAAIPVEGGNHTNQQNDPLEYIRCILNQAGEALQIMLQTGNADTAQPAIEGSVLGLAMPSNAPTYTLPLLLNHFFEEDASRSEFPQKKQLGHAPDHLLVCLQRFQAKQTSSGYRMAKVARPVEMDLSLEIKQKWVYRSSSAVRYEAEGFIHHIGNSITSGHYIAYVKREGKWWECNDQRITEVSEDTAKRMIKQSYVVAYKRIDERPQLC